MASARKSSRLRARPGRRRRNAGKPRTYVLCVKNKKFEFWLQVRKIYARLPEDLADHGWLRIIDDEGEDYLYPPDYFIPVKLSPTVERVVAALRD